MRQLSLLKKPSLQFGGSPKTPHIQRVLSSKKPTHLVLKSKNKFVLFKKREEISKIFKKQAKAHGITIYSWSIQKDHIHISLKIPNREAYNKWIRAVTGLIARLLGKGMWLTRPFTRILSGVLKEFWALNNYIFRNEMEAFKIWTYDRSKTVEEMAKVTRTQLIRI